MLWLIIASFTAGCGGAPEATVIGQLIRDRTASPWSCPSTTSSQNYRRWLGRNQPKPKALPPLRFFQAYRADSAALAQAVGRACGGGLDRRRGHSPRSIWTRRQTRCVADGSMRRGTVWSTLLLDVVSLRLDLPCSGRVPRAAIHECSWRRQPAPSSCHDAGYLMAIGVEKGAAQRTPCIR